LYGGLVRAENLLSVLMQCLAIACVVSVLWLLTFNGAGPWIGDLGRALLRGAVTSTGFPETVFFMFQMTLPSSRPG
jgi:Amt family ammonium transporter